MKVRRTTLAGMACVTFGVAAVAACSSDDSTPAPTSLDGGLDSSTQGDSATVEDSASGSDDGAATGGDSSVDAGPKTDAEAGSVAGAGGPNSLFDGTKTVELDTVNVTFNASGPSAGYLGYKADLSYSAGIGGVSSVGTFTCANASLTHAQPGFVSYSSSYGASTCTINVTSFPTNSGDHFTGTYSGTIFRPDGVTSITLTNGKFDGVRP